MHLTTYRDVVPLRVDRVREIRTGMRSARFFARQCRRDNRTGKEQQICRFAFRHAFPLHERAVVLYLRPLQWLG